MEFRPTVRGEVGVYRRSKYGEEPEWTIGAISKTVVGLAPTVDSNPTLSAGGRGGGSW